MNRCATAITIMALLAIGVISFKPQSNKIADAYQLDTLASNVRVPWQLTFLPDRSIIFTERTGKIRMIKNDQLLAKPLYEFKDVRVNYKNGLLGMAIHPNFESTKWIYIAHNYGERDRPKLKIIRLSFARDTLINPKVLMDEIPAAPNHTGCRLIFGPDQKLYISTGDADRPIDSQDLKKLNGKILRLNDDGTIPSDNPFVSVDTAQQAIWSYGHRNVQGMAFQPKTNLLYVSEHGPTGGDEINVVEKGKNYGWPVIHHQMQKDGMVTPIRAYTPSIGPSDATFYTSTVFPELKDKLLIACLRGEAVLSLAVDGKTVISEELFFKNKFKRIRSLIMGPDGYLYLSTSQYDMPEAKGEPPFDLIVRIRPAKAAQLVSGKIVGNTTANKKLTTAALYTQMCASCHGEHLEGTDRARAVVNGKFFYGSDLKSIAKNINEGIISKGMPAWNGAISQKEIQNLAAYMQRIAQRNN